jgi:hypothetical protein
MAITNPTLVPLMPGEYVVAQGTMKALNAASTLTAPTIRIGKVELREQDIQDLLNIREFIDTLVATDPKAAEIMIAIKARHRILK